jgi:hypothetical protein
VRRRGDMLFQVVHTHDSANCPARAAESMRPVSDWWNALKKTQGVKVISGLVSPLEHTYYITVEADDFTTLTKALGPLLSIGAGGISPVLSMDQTLPLAESGIFRATR